MRWVKVIIASVCLLAPAEYAMAQALDALAYETMEPSRIKLGESATLRVTSFGHLKDVALPTIPGLVFEEMGQSQGFDFVNGTAIPATFILIRVTPQFAGVFSIPGLTPTSRSIGLEVVKGDEPNPYTWRSQQPAPAPARIASLPKGVPLQAGGAAFVHLAVPARPIYVGESVPVEIEVGLRSGVVTSVNGLPTLKGSDFTFNNLSRQPERREEAIEGGAFVVLTWHSALTAVKPGDFSLSAETPLTVKMSTLSAADRAVASKLAWPLLQSMYNGVAPKDMTIESSPSELKVLPLPREGRPKSFSGAVGDFQLTSDISPASVAAGEMSLVSWKSPTAPLKLLGRPSLGSGRTFSSDGELSIVMSFGATPLYMLCKSGHASLDATALSAADSVLIFTVSGVSADNEKSPGFTAVRALCQVSTTKAPPSMASSRRSGCRDRLLNVKSLPLSVGRPFTDVTTPERKPTSISTGTLSPTYMGRAGTARWTKAAPPACSGTPFGSEAIRAGAGAGCWLRQV